VSSTAGTWHQPQESIFAFPSEGLLDCNYAEENIAGFVLGSLEFDDEMRIVRHVSWCPACARLLHETRKTVSYLPYLSPQSAPSIAAKRSLFDRIAADQLLNPVGVASELAPAAMASSIDLLGDPVGHVMAADMSPSKAPKSKRRFSWEMVAAPLAAVPLVIALALVGGWAYNTQQRLEDQSAQAKVLKNENAKLVAQVSNIFSPQTTKYALDSGESLANSEATGKLVVNPSQTSATLYVWDLPQSAAGYEVLVYTSNGTLQNAGDFTVDQNGFARYDLTLSQPLTNFQSIHVQRLTAGESTSSDAASHSDVLWMDSDTNLGDQGDTEASAKSH